MKTIVIGLGNPILGDDAVAWKVAETVRQYIDPSPDILVDIDFLALGGISLMEHLIGYDRIILIDALVSQEEPGAITVFTLDEIPNCSAFHITSVHDTSLQNAMNLGKALGAELTNDITLVGICIKPVYDFGLELSPPIREAVPKAAQIVMDLLTQNITIR
jgi:hydrogenase maturation protease